MTDIKLEILPSGHIKFKRGSKEYNEKVRLVMSHIFNNDEEIMKDIDEFLIGSEESELLIGDTILCG